MWHGTVRHRPGAAPRLLRVATRKTTVSQNAQNDSGYPGGQHYGGGSTPPPSADQYGFGSPAQQDSPSQPGAPVQQGYPQGYPQQGYQQGAPQQNPGRTMGIVGLILAFFPIANIAGLILSILGLRRSRRAGMSNVPAVVGIVVSILTIIGMIVGGILMGTVLSHIVEVCGDLGPGEHFVDGVTYTCG